MRRLAILLLIAVPAFGQSMMGTSHRKVGGGGGSISSMTLIGSKTNCPTSGTTCTVPISPNITAGQAVLACGYSHSTNDAWLASTDNSGSSQIVQAAYNWSDPGSALGVTSCLLIPNAGAESTNIIVTFSAAQSNAAAIAVWADSYTGSPALDGANSRLQTSVSTSTAPTFTPSNGNDTAVMQVTAFQNVSSFTGMTADTTGTHFGRGHNLSFSGALTPTAPLAASASAVVNNEVYLGYGVTSPKSQTVQLFSGTNATNPTSATLATGTLGWQGSLPWSVIGTNTDLTYDTAASKTLQNTTGRLNDGSNTTDSTTTGLTYATGHATTKLNLGTSGHPISSASVVTLGSWIQTSHAVADAFSDDALGVNGTGIDTAIAKSFDASGVSRTWSFDCASTGVQFVNALALNTWYWITLQYSATAPAANLVLTSVTNASGGTTVYSGTITGGGSNALAGNYYYVTGFGTDANNGGPFLASASTTGTLTLSNASGVSETHAANAAQTDSAGLAGLHVMKVYDSSTPPVLQATVACPAQGQKASSVFIGNANAAASGAGYHYYFDSFKMSLDGTFPLLP